MRLPTCSFAVYARLVESSIEPFLYGLPHSLSGFLHVSPFAQEGSATAGVERLPKLPQDCSLAASISCSSTQLAASDCHDGLAPAVGLPSDHRSAFRGPFQHAGTTARKALRSLI